MECGCPSLLFSALYALEPRSRFVRLECGGANRPLNMLMERVLVDKPWPDLYDGGREKERGEREGKEKERIRIKLQNVASVEVGSENN